MKASVRKIQIGVLVFLAVLSCFVWVVAISKDRGNNLRVTFLDVGQGDAILIRVS